MQHHEEMTQGDQTKSGSRKQTRKEEGKNRRNRRKDVLQVAHSDARSLERGGVRARVVSQWVKCHALHERACDARVGGVQQRREARVRGKRLVEA